MSLDLYDEEIASKVCEHISCGATIEDVCMLHGMPKLIDIFVWREEIPDFKEKYSRALKRRAEIWKDRAVRIASMSEKNTATADKLHVDTLKWALTIDNPTYDPRSKVTDAGNGVFIIDTGIKRPEEEAKDGDRRPPEVEGNVAEVEGSEEEPGSEGFGAFEAIGRDSRGSLQEYGDYEAGGDDDDSDEGTFES